MRRRTLNANAVVCSCIVPICTLVSGCGVDCSLIESDASKLRAGVQRCSAGDTCEIVSMYEVAGPNNCLGAFQCDAAVNSNTDLDALRHRARKLVDGYSSCGHCAMAGCISSEGRSAFCNTQSGLCEISD